MTPLIDEHAARAAGCCGICGAARSYLSYGTGECDDCREMFRYLVIEMPDDELETIRQRVRDVRAAKWN